MSERRIIDRLREEFPDVAWAYEPRRGVWDGDDGSQVRATCSIYEEWELGSPPAYFRHWPGTDRVPEMLW